MFDRVLADIKVQIAVIAPLAARESEKCPLLYKLPFEIREKIFQYVIGPSTIAVFLPGRRGQKPTPIKLPELVRVGNRQLRLEALYITLMQTTFKVHCGPGNEKLQAWLLKIDFSKAA